MLFDLRSPGRRNTVRVVYIFLAIVMVAGLLLVGVGTGSGGGILNALGGSNNNSSNNSGQSQLLQNNLAKAEKAVKKNPGSVSALSALFQARLELARNHATSANLNATAAAWQKYVAASNGKPSSFNAESAAYVYQALKNYNEAGSAWEYMIEALPASDHSLLTKPYECLALNAYAAGQTSKAEQAQVRALKLTPSTERSTLKTELNGAKKTTSTAKTDVSQACVG